MEMTDVYWRLISYYLNLVASQKSIGAHFAGEGMERDGRGGRGGEGRGGPGWVAGRVEEAGSAGGGSEALGRQRAEPDKKKKK